jgi:hypothetical protein
MTTQSDTTLAGSCHCKNITVTLRAPVPVEQLQLRACQCTFCTRHGARTTSHPDGNIEIAAADPAEVGHYRFGLGTADFLLCRRCGVFVAAVLTEGDAHWAVVNVNTLDERERFLQAPARMNYDGEDADTRVARRKVRWSPATLRL